ncbi:AMP-binding protein [Streptomyces sp. NPDC088116]|uniref:AMP-binding protein n=1 Tax=Streptomyces sp. NPDC088116 TaxID=3365825 RepID=UPI00380913E6
MGRPAFIRFLTGRHHTVAAAHSARTAPTGVRWGRESATWDDLLARGRDRSVAVRAGGTYAVDPAAGLEALASLFAVAVVPDTVLLWAAPEFLGVAHRQAAPALSEVAAGELPLPRPGHRPMWGVCTSGTSAAPGASGRPKVAIGHADEWELIALHCEAAIYRDALPDGPPEALATCLPLGFSAAFFMSVLPALLFRRDLLVFSPHDWSPLYELARTRRVAALGVPALAAAACLAEDGPTDMGSVALFLGGGHLSGPRVDLIRERFTGVSLSNLYGTAETGAVALDHAPGHNRHVGRPVAGKSVWLLDPDERGIGAVAVEGPGRCRHLWRPGTEPVASGSGEATGTDYARFDEDGNLCLEGRLDGGEKLSGVLVYPREIERHVLALDGVGDVRVSVERAPSGLEFLAARVIGGVDERTVRDHCEALPERHRPSRITCASEREAASAYSTHGKL